MRRARLTGSLLLLVVSLQWSVSPSASAEVDCEGRFSCVHEHSGQTGCRFAVHGSEPRLNESRYFNCGEDVEDSISSFSNPTQNWFVLYEHPNYKGASLCIRPGASGDLPRSLNDKVSSIHASGPGMPAKGC